MEKIVEMMVKGDSIFLGNDSQAPAVTVIARGSLTAATTNAVGGVIKLQNTTGYDLYVKHMLVDVTTESTGAANLDIGVDKEGDTSNDGLFDGLDVGTAVVLASNLVDGGTNGGIVRWKKDEYIVATASATTAGMVGTYYIEAIPV